MITIDSSDDDEDEERICENGTNYVEAYLHKNEGDHDEAVTAHLRAKLRKKPRYLHRYGFLKTLKYKFNSRFYLEMF